MNEYINDFILIFLTPLIQESFGVNVYGQSMGPPCVEINPFY